MPRPLIFFSSLPRSHAPLPAQISPKKSKDKRPIYPLFLRSGNPFIFLFPTSTIDACHQKWGSIRYVILSNQQSPIIRDHAVIEKWAKTPISFWSFLFFYCQPPYCLPPMAPCHQSSSYQSPPWSLGMVFFFLLFFSSSYSSFILFLSSLFFSLFSQALSLSK